MEIPKNLSDALMAVFFLLAFILYQAYHFKFSFELIVLVSSARENFDHRTIIRNTWACNESGELGNQIKVFFVVGDKSCPFPTEDRLDAYSCRPWTPQTTHLQITNQEALISSAYDDKSHRGNILEPQPVGLELTASRYPRLKLFIAFRILHPIIIRKFGLHKSIKADASLPRIPVVLLNGGNQEEVVRVHFSDIDPGIPQNNFYYQPVEAFLLPKDFEGILMLDIPENTDISYSDNINNISAAFCLPPDSNTVIYFYQSNPDIRCWSQLATNFIYDIDDFGVLERHITGRPERHKKWTAEKWIEEQRLLDEKNKFSDLMVVQQIDVYRNLPNKLLLAQKELMKWHKYSYVLKTDDDCFLNLKQILKHLDSIKYKTFWSGKFRSNWAVDRYGKWAEWLYDSVVYPKFACGSGNVFTSDISQWLANSSDYLKVYQGEDVTMGIWLAAAFGPVTVDDQRWHCTKTCSPDMFSMPDLTTEELSRMWADKMNCGNPCGCE
ncbi:UDP-GalNAc:beta-1,3-N-acetylgalactosaminyltransferase c:beta-1,3-N- [Octopus vulgaris]|uniref:Hexosyltransferase n=1 Tax=Octopus vulgaris TaxID=6645 RepID=A0AA36FL96_OCTVU|nr:UDP-GalNAc:beta-1,3-N-acetylgalactosaminyltransferase c:beta-1,3-N- [Octopus vulgaris]